MDDLTTHVEFKRFKNKKSYYLWKINHPNTAVVSELFDEAGDVIIKYLYWL